MNLHFGIRTINQTRQIKQLCSLKETEKNKITTVITVEAKNDVIKKFTFYNNKGKQHKFNSF